MRKQSHRDQIYNHEKTRTIKKHIGTLVIIAVYVVVLSFIYFRFFSISEEVHESDILNYEKIEYYKNLLVERHGIDINKLEFIELTEEHYRAHFICLWRGRRYSLFPDFIRFNYNGKPITILGEVDDFYFDELVESIKYYYRYKLNIDDVFIELQADIVWISNLLAPYANHASIPVFDKNIIEGMLNQRSKITLIVQIDDDDIEYNIKRLIEKLNFLPHEVIVHVMSDISMIYDYRERTPLSFDRHQVSGVDFDYRFTRIAPHSIVGYTNLNGNHYGYYFRAINEGAKRQ